MLDEHPDFYNLNEGLKAAKVLNLFKEQCSKRVQLTQQQYKKLQSNDPSKCMPLTKKQCGLWEGRIETFEYALKILDEFRYFVETVPLDSCTISEDTDIDI